MTVDEARAAVLVDHRPVCRWPHDMDAPGHCVGQCEDMCAAEGEQWPCPTAVVLADLDRMTAKVAEANALAEHLDGEADTYPNSPGVDSLRSAATRIRGALSYEIHNPRNHEAAW